MGNSIGAPAEGRFVRNVVWNWAGVILSIFTGLLLSPIFVRTLGADLYGIWALSFSVVEYYWLFDLGLRAAAVKSVAHYHATGEPEKINQVISTSLAYAAGAAVLILTLVFSLIHPIAAYFNVAPHYRDSFITLLRLLTISCCAGLILNLFSVSLEAVQRFDLTGRIAVVCTAIRAFGTAILLYLGFGLIEIAIVTILSQVVGYILTFNAFWTVFPNLRISWRFASWRMLKELGQYAIHSFVANTAVIINSQSAPVLIGHYWPASYVGFYMLPLRLISIAVDFVGRVGLVTNTKAAELTAKRQLDALANLAIYTNRYCLTIFLPLSIFLWVYRLPLFLFWMGPVVAPFSAPLMPILVLGNVLGVVGQFSSSMLLMGMGRHQRYARGVAVETAIGFMLLWLTVPRYGLVGAAWSMMVPLVLNRGFYAAWLVSQETNQPFGLYLSRIYIRPLSAALAVGLLAWALQAYLLPGTHWVQLLLAAALIAAAYYGLAFSWCLETEHQERVWGWWGTLRQRLAV